MFAVWQIDVGLTPCGQLVPRIEVLQHSSPHQAQEFNRFARGLHITLAYSPRCRASSPPGIRPGSWGIAMPSSTAVSLAASPEQIAPVEAESLHESDITLMRRSGERYSENRRPLLLSGSSQRVQEVVSAVPDQRVVRPTQRKIQFGRVLGGAKAQLRNLWAQSRLPSNATALPAYTQKPPDRHLPARLVICRFAYNLGGLTSLFYVEVQQATSLPLCNQFCCISYLESHPGLAFS